MSDLHGRITAALLREDQLRVCKLSDADIKFMADAVIRELGLREETNYVYFMTEGFGGPLKPGNNRRYVTEWETK